MRQPKHQASSTKYQIPKEFKMPQHDVEIEISPQGKVRVHVKGAKGKICMEYAAWLARIVGKVEEQTQTSEFYEPEVKTRLDLHQELRED
jgi:hypothetical protein